MPLTERTEIELIEQEQRLNDYPPQWARMANILERRPEARIFYKMEDTFFKLIDFKIAPILVVGLLIVVIIYGKLGKGKR